MVHNNNRSVWREGDRACGQCAGNPAREDDWLCGSCRASLEAHWTRLTNVVEQGHSRYDAARQDNSQSIRRN